MYDRERDYNWIYDKIAADLDTIQSRDTVSHTATAGFTESSDTKRKIRLWQLSSSWKADQGGNYFPQLVKLSVDQTDQTLATLHGYRLYESMNDHALSDGPLEFPMVGWPYYVRNPNKDLAFNDLKIAKLATAVNESRIADKLFVELNCPTMAEMWGKNRELRASKITMSSGKTEFDLTDSTHYKSTLSINSKAGSNTSSHCAMIHIPPLPLLDGTTNF